MFCISSVRLWIEYCQKSVLQWPEESQCLSLSINSKSWSLNLNHVTLGKVMGPDESLKAAFQRALRVYLGRGQDDAVDQLRLCGHLNLLNDLCPPIKQNHSVEESRLWTSEREREGWSTRYVSSNKSRVSNKNLLPVRSCVCHVQYISITLI